MTDYLWTPLLCQTAMLMATLMVLWLLTLCLDSRKQAGSQCVKSYGAASSHTSSYRRFWRNWIMFSSFVSDVSRLLRINTWNQPVTAASFEQQVRTVLTPTITGALRHQEKEDTADNAGWEWRCAWGTEHQNLAGLVFDVVTVTVGCGYFNNRSILSLLLSQCCKLTVENTFVSA